MMALAFSGPIPGRVSSSIMDAVLRLTFKDSGSISELDEYVGERYVNSVDCLDPTIRRIIPVRIMPMSIPIETSCQLFIECSILIERVFVPDRTSL